MSSVSLYPLRHAYMASTISGHFVGEHSLTSADETRCTSLINRCDACKRQHIRDWTKIVDILGRNSFLLGKTFNIIDRV